MVERRRFARILCQAPVLLSRGDRCWDMELLDLSLRGAMLKGLPITLVMALPQCDTHILMQARIVYRCRQLLGLECLSLDRVSADHLKRLVALALGSTQLLYRELAQLDGFDDDLAILADEL